MSRRIAAVAAVGLALMTLAATKFGGWAVVTVENPPEYMIAGKPLDLTFTVRQHGVQLMSGLTPSIEARSGLRSVSGRISRGRRIGEFNGTLTVESAGSWQITVNSGFGRSKTTLLPIPVQKPGAAPPVLSEPDRGRMLFAAKGCVTCHVRDDVGVEGTAQSVGPNLTGRTFPREYLASFLHDPSIKPPTKPGFRMPDLGLKSTEIASLVAFINSERALSSR